MKAMQFKAYGDPSNVVSVDLSLPVPKGREVRVNVRATAINPIDWKLFSGALRWVMPLKFPQIPCFDFAGTVDAVGPEASHFQVGQPVFGMLPIRRLGAAAEALLVDENLAAAIPLPCAIHPMAALPLAGMTALQALKDHGQIKAGERVLIIGGAGGVGHFGIQIASQLGATVTAIGSTQNLDFMRSLGARKVLDYTQPDFALGERSFDIILDANGQRPFKEWETALAPEGRFISLLPSLPIFMHGLRLKITSKRRIHMVMVKPQRSDLEWLAAGMAEGSLTVHIEKEYPLEHLAQAFEQSQKGHTRGKILINVS